MKRISRNFFVSLSLFFFTACGKDSGGSAGNQSNTTAILSFTEAPKFDFGIQLVDSSTEKAFTITNVGSVPATQISGSFYFSLSFSFKGGNFPGDGGTCTDTLQPLTSCTVTVVFSPKSTGPTESTLTVTYNNGLADTSTAGPNLTGQGN